MTKRKADGFLASIKVYTYLCKKKDANFANRFWNSLLLLHG